MISQGQHILSVARFSIDAVCWVCPQRARKGHALEENYAPASQGLLHSMGYNVFQENHLLV
jgi:hypothetical protein